MLEINKFSSFILKDISFSLKENENLIILGENGAGKSTLARVLCNLLESTKVKLFNENISHIEDLKRSELINYIPPYLDIFDEYLTVYEFLELSFISNIDVKRLDNVIREVGIEKIKNRSCVNLSSGEKQLLLLASSMIHNARITIFDELTANMDISRLKDAYSFFSSNLLRQKIIITHNLDLAFHLKYKILFLEDGKIKFFGSSKDFFKQENLNIFYNNSLKIIDGHLVVKL